MRSLPKISVIVPSFNKVKYIEATLQSIADQKYPNLEVIVQDGGSTDGTVEIIKKYAAKYPRIIGWESKKDKGQVDAINNGLKKATGAILAYINADDVYKKGALIKVGEYFANHPKTLWLAGRGDMIDSKGKKISPLVTKYKNYLLTINHYPSLLIVNYLMQPSVFLSSKAYKKYGPFTGTKTAVMEYDLWLKLGRVQMPAILKSNLSSFRISEGSISSSSFKKTLKEDEEIVEKYTDNPVLLLLHYLHNIGRVVAIFLLNNQ
ncbi:glycosyltransferase [Patescibacteria group bacterium]|nr:glycosyltransferase [Patescibacteria group bacterium]